MQNVDNSSPSICDASVKQKDLKVNYGQSVHLSCPFHVNDFESSTAKYGPLKWYFYRNERSSGVEVSSRRDKFALTTDNGLVILGTSDRESGRYECKLGSLPLIRYEIFVDPSKSISLSLLLFSLMLSLFDFVASISTLSNPDDSVCFSHLLIKQNPVPSPVKLSSRVSTLTGVTSLKSTSQAWKPGKSNRP